MEFVLHFQTVMLAENILSFGLGQTDYTFVSFSFAFQNILMSSHVLAKMDKMRCSG